MSIKLKEKRFNHLRREGFLWIGMVCMILSLSSASYAVEPISISHTLFGYTEDGSIITLDFSLDITNNGDVALLDAEISTAPIGPMAHRLLEPIPGQSPVYIGYIPASHGSISVNYTVQSTLILPEEEINSFPICWEIKYIDETGQAQIMVVESQPASSL